MSDLTHTRPRLPQVFRHGDRSAINDVPSLPPFAWPDGLGQLTERGMLMHANVGQYMRARYVGPSKLLAAGYHRNETVVRSTDVDRTLQSALSQLLTWFPAAPAVFPGGDAASSWQPVPVHTVPTSIDFELRPFDDGSCPRYTALAAAHASTPAYQAKLAEVVPAEACAGVGLPAPCNNTAFLRRLAQLCGVPVSLTLTNLYTVADPIFCRTEHGDMTLPSWARNAPYEHMLDLADWAMYDMFTGAEERRLTGGNLLKALLGNIDARLDPTAVR
jgi:hypothetical protein